LRRAALAVLMGSVLVSWLVVPAPIDAITASIPLVVGIAGNVLLSEIAWRRGRQVWFVRGLCLMAAVVSLVATVAMPLHYGGRWPHATLVPLLPPERLPDTLNSNVIAGTLVLLWPFPWCLGLQDRNSLPNVLANRVIAILTGLLLYIILFLTFSRGALVAVTAATLLWLAWWRQGLRRWLALMVAIAALALLWRAGVWGLQDGVARQALMQSVHVRFEIWSRAVRFIQAYPLTGIGFGNFQKVLLHTAPLTLTRLPAVTHAHNLALQVALDLGLPGLSAVVVLVFCAFRDAWRAFLQFDEVSDAWLRLVAIGCLCALTGMTIHGLVDSAVWGNKGAFVPWIVMGFCTLLSRWAANKETED
jgi:putative inorganic carbon (HCO3(-)) transporter